MNHLLSFSDIKLMLISYNMFLVFGVISSCIILLIAWYSNKLLHGAITKISKRSNFDQSLISLLHNVASIGIYVAAGCLILENLNIQTRSLLGFVGLLSVGAGLALQKIIANIASGMFILTYKPFAIGNYISCSHPHATFEGKVTSIDLRTTKLVHGKNTILVPNQILYENVITITDQQ